MPVAAEMAGAAEVVAVVTAFRPGEGMLDLVRSLTPQVARVIVVDDGSGAGGSPDDASDAVLAAAGAAGAEVVRHPTNRGIAAALNTGIRAAGSTASVITFDQDSRIAPDLVAALVATLREATAAGLRVGLVAPAAVEGLPSPATGQSHGFALAEAPIQSGLLIPRSTIDAVGRFTEPLFIDCVDTDFALRTREAGLVVLLAPGTRLGHSLGRRHTPTLFGHPLVIGGEPFSLVYSASFRYYYLVRNRILMNRMHGRGRLRWAVRETVADLRHCAIALALVPGRAARARAVLAGFRDGWAGRSGRIPAALEQRLKERP